MIYIDNERCNGCGDCIEICPNKAIHWVEGNGARHVTIDQAKCDAFDVDATCVACLDVCTAGAIRVGAEPAEAHLVPQGERSALPARPAVRRLAWLGPALAFVGREIVPRLARYALDAWDQRAAQRAAPSERTGTSLTQQETVADAAPRGGHQHRHRERGGGC